MKKTSLKLTCGTLGAATLLLCGCTTIPASENARDVALVSYSRPEELKMAAAADQVQAMPAAYRAKANRSRQMAYAMTLHLDCPDLAQASRQAQEATVKLGGYAVYADHRRAEFKVPDKQAEAALAAYRQIGVITEQQLSASDETDAITDVAMRLDNLEKLRARLTELLKRTDKVADLLAVEKELARITQEQERLRAQQKNLATRVNYLHFTLFFNQNDTEMNLNTPPVAITWVSELGTLAGMPLTIPAGKVPDQPFKLRLPAGFLAVPTPRNATGYFAVNAENVVLRATRQPNHAGGAFGFWRPFINGALKNAANYTIQGDTLLQTASGDDFAEFRAMRTLGAKQQSYVLSVFLDRPWLWGDGSVCVLEIWGPREALQKVDLDTLRNSIRL